MSILYTSFSSQRLGAYNPSLTPSTTCNTSQPCVSSRSLADKKEIHQAKMGASFWAGAFGILGPLKPLWDSLFYNPNKAAKNRLDVKTGQRTLASGEALEREKKSAQLKASAVPAAIGLCSRSLPFFDFGTLAGVATMLTYYFFEKPEAPDFNEKL
jgi:hypothetical protein